MIVATSPRFIFLALQKTGSSSVELALRPWRSTPWTAWLMFRYRYFTDKPTGEVFKHVSAAVAKDLVGQRMWQQSFTFAFVRNPWDRMVSLYHYHRSLDGTPFQEKAGRMTFREWLLAGGTGSAKRSMTDFMLDRDGRHIVDFVGRFESLEEDFAHVARELDLDLQLPHVNRSRRDARSYREFYDDDTAALVGERHRRDIETFDYEF